MLPYISTSWFDNGKKLLNLIFINLYRNRKNIYYFKNPRMIDVIVKSTERYELYNISDRIEDRHSIKNKFKALIEGQNYFPDSDSRMLVKEHTYIPVPDRISFQLIWKYLALDNCNKI